MSDFFPVSPSKLKIAENCMAQYFYRYIHPDRSSLPATGRMALGNLFHRLMEGFYREDGTPKYESVESFVNMAIGQWKFILRSNKSRGKDLVWSYDAEKWVILNKEVPEIAASVYKTYSSMEKPVAQEHTFNVVINGIEYFGFVDAVLRFDESIGKVRIGDFKTSRGIPSQKRLARDHQFAAYHLAMGFELKDNLELRKRVGMPDELAEWVGKGRNYMSPYIQVEWHHLRTGEIVPIEAERTLEDYVWLVASIEDRIGQIDDGNFSRSPSNRKCLDCLAREICEREVLEGTGLLVPDEPQLRRLPVGRRKKGFKKHQYKLGFPDY